MCDDNGEPLSDYDRCNLCGRPFADHPGGQCPTDDPVIRCRDCYGDVDDDKQPE